MNFNKKNILFLLFINILLLQDDTVGQIRSYGIHNGNQVRTVFSNTGIVAQPDISGLPRGAWIHDSNGYVGDVSILVGAEIETEDVDGNNVIFHSVEICPVDRPISGNPEWGGPDLMRFGFEPVPGYYNQFNSDPNKVAMSTNLNTWPYSWPNDECDWNGEWCGYFGKNTQKIQQESFYVLDDRNDLEFNYANYNDHNVAFKPSSIDYSMNGLGLEVKVRGMQWQNLLAQDCIFFLYEITNNSTTEYKKVVLGELVGTYVGSIESEADDDWSFFDVENSLVYTGDYGSDCSENSNWVGDVGMVGYAFLESPGNPYDGIDNDGDSTDIDCSNSPESNCGDDFCCFVEDAEGNFAPITIALNSEVITIDENYKRKKTQILNQETTLMHHGESITITIGDVLVEGNIIDGRVNNNAYDGIDNDLDGLIDENYYLHYRQKKEDPVNNNVIFDIVNPRAHINYYNIQTYDEFVEFLPSLLIDESRVDGIDNDNDWNANIHDVGADGVPATNDEGEGNGFPDDGEPNFDRTDPDESDQIGLTSFDYFVPSNAYPESDDEALWEKLSPGFFDAPPSIQDEEPQGGEDGDFIFGSGYFPLRPGQTERFSIALLYGEDKDDLYRNRETVQTIFDSDYQFASPPSKPTLTVVPGNSKVTLYWDRVAETSIDPVTGEYDFQGYKIYRATDPNFNDVRNITNAYGVIEDFSPIEQFDLNDDIQGLFYPNDDIFQQSGGLSFNLGNNTGIVHKYVDNNLINGRTYYYAVTAYDQGSPSEWYPSENTKFITVLPSGEIITDKNTGIATPTTSSLGLEIDNVEINHEAGFGTGNIICEIVDETQITDHKYLIEFWDSSNDEMDNNLDLEFDSNDYDEIIPITTFYSVKDQEGITINFSLASDETSFFDLGKKNIIESSFQLHNQYNILISPNNYILNPILGQIQIDETFLPGSFIATFNYYPIYKSPYIQNSQWIEKCIDLGEGNCNEDQRCQWILNGDDGACYDECQQLITTNTCTSNPRCEWEEIDQSGECDVIDNYDGTSLWIEGVNDAEVFDGLMLNFNNDWNISYVNNKWIIDEVEISDDNSNIMDIEFTTLDIDFSSFGIDFYLTAYKSPNDYKIVFSDNPTFGLDIFDKPTNFKIYDITNDKELEFASWLPQSNNEIPNLFRISIFEEYESDIFDEYEPDIINPIDFSNTGIPGAKQINSNLLTWDLEFLNFQNQENPVQFGEGDELYIYTSKPFRDGDEFLVIPNTPYVNSSSNDFDFSKIKVVPNPYIAATALESSLPPGITRGRGERKVEFQNVPNDAIIKIFNIRGQHIVTLNHDGDIFDGSITWDLRTKENMDIAYGVYLYVLQSAYGSKKGKIAIIK